MVEAAAETEDAQAARVRVYKQMHLSKIILINHYYNTCQHVKKTNLTHSNLPSVEAVYSWKSLARTQGLIPDVRSVR